jgi:hypothetical protein
MKTLLLVAASTLTLGLAAPAFAQDHSEHQAETPAPAPAPAEDHSAHEGHVGAPDAPAPEGDHCVVSLEGGGQMACRDPDDHTQMDHSQMDHSQMDHGVAAEGAVDHGALGHALAEGPIEASGTSRLPQAEGMMPGVHFDLGGGWMGMAHGYAWGVYSEQTGPRGDDMAFVQSMAMLMAEKEFDGGRLQLKSMFSADPLIGDRGYPILFGTGETAGGVPLVDRQHPHDFVMELAARADFDIAEGTTAFLYGGPVGEPALGPPAFMHRASSKLNPEAPITHHWFDSTHITFGVVTAGVASRLWQIEASAFRGQEPDEDRWDIEEPRLDSWSVRATLTPSPNWALQVSHGRLDEPEALHLGQDEARTTTSVHYNSGTGLAATAAFAAKNRMPGPTLTAWLAEANWDITDRHALFGRIENVENDELFPDHAHPLHDQPFRVTKLQAGYAYTLPLGPFALSLGGSAAAFLKPDALDPFYGEDPMGYTLFAKLTLGR